MTRFDCFSVARRRALATAMRLVRDDRGNDLIEYALLTTAVGFAGIAAFTLLSGAIQYAYTTWNAGQQNLWRPPNP